MYGQRISLVAGGILKDAAAGSRNGICGGSLPEPTARFGLSLARITTHRRGISFFFLASPPPRLFYFLGASVDPIFYAETFNAFFFFFLRGERGEERGKVRTQVENKIDCILTTRHGGLEPPRLWPNLNIPALETLGTGFTIKGKK